MATVTIGTETYDVYISLPDAKAYLLAEVSATVWNDPGTTDDQRSAAIVSMTRTLDRQVWLGKEGDVYQPHAFPRSGLVYSDGTDVPDNIVPTQVIEATAEGASQLLNGVPLQDESTTFDPTKLLKAGSVEIMKFRTLDASPRFPTVIDELVGLWLAGYTGPLGSEAFGTQGKSIMGEQYNVNRGF